MRSWVPMSHPISAVAVSIAAMLDASVPSDRCADLCAERSVDRARVAVGDSVPEIPVWWNRDLLVEITSPDDCVSAWSTWRPRAAAGSSPYTVSMTLPNGTRFECRTVEEWHTARREGGSAHSTLDMSMESHFIERALAFGAIPCLDPAQRSGFDPARWHEQARHLIALDDACAGGVRLARRSAAGDGHGAVKAGAAADAARGVASPAPGNAEAASWSIEPAKVSFEDAAAGAWARVLARGDYDGDGWEDLVVSAGGFSKEGSLRHYRSELHTCRASGRVIDTTVRLLDGMPSRADLARHRLALESSFGLPEDSPIGLTGFMKSGDRTLAISASLVVSDGFVTGTYRSEGGSGPIPLEGTLGPGGALTLAEFALGDQPNARFTLSWRRAGSAIAIEGLWRESSEGNRVTMTGALSPLGAQPAGPQSTEPRPNGPHPSGSHPSGSHLNGSHLNGSHLNGSHLNGSHLNGSHPK